MDENSQKDNNNQNDNGAPKPSIFEPISMFPEDPNFAFVFKKGQKLSGALYLVTSFLSDTEPLKWSLRELANDLLTVLIILKDKMSGSREECVHEIKRVVFDILSRLEVASFAGLISEMNSSVFKKEFAVLIDRLEDKVKNGTGPLILSSSLFDIAEYRQTLPPRAPETPRTEVSRIENPIKDKFNIGVPQYGNSNTHSQGHNGFVLPKPNGNGHKGPKPSLQNKKNGRREYILNIITKKIEVTIKDISNIMKDCSEKTIQRELAYLVEEGVLKREGERRWSKYSFI